MKTHNEMVSKWKKDPKFKKEYDGFNEEFTILKEMLRARKTARLSHAEVAKRMGTKTPAIARLEAAGGSKRHSPSVATLRKYADAVGCRLEIKIIPR